MIDAEGFCRCGKCGKKLARYTPNMDIEIPCPRSSCKRYNLFKRKDLLQSISRLVKSIL